MNLSLEESKKIQTDHYRRCKEMCVDPQRTKDDETSYKTLVGFLPDKKCKILDLGCGEASAYSHLSEHDYYGLECVEEALEIAKKKVESPDNLKLGMIEEIPFEDEFFDVIWARHILEHSSDMEKTLNEIIRVLKSDGLLIYALPQGKHNEPAHLYQTDRTGWFKLLSSKFGMLKDGTHRFNLNEYYGVCKKTLSKDQLDVAKAARIARIAQDCVDFHKRALPQDWAQFHGKALPYEQAIAKEPFRMLIDTIIMFANSHKINHVCETGFGTGYIMIRLAQEINLTVAGIEQSELLIECAKKLALEMKAHILIEQGNIFDVALILPEFVPGSGDSNNVIYHQGLLEHFSNEKIWELLRLQTKNSFAVIFSVPSKFYGKQDFGDERLLTLKEWKEILKPFEVYQLRYYDNNKHILGILKGGFYGYSDGA